MTPIALIYFVLLAVVGVLSAAGTVASRTPIRAAMCLLTLILSLAALYISLYAHLLGAMQLIVYAGAVVVLFVFVIMLIGPTQEENEKPMTSGGLARVLSVCVMAGVTLSIASAVGGIAPALPTVEGCPGGVPECAQYGGVRGVANVLYQDGVVPFELISILLTVAILGAIAVARGRTLGEVNRRKAAELANAAAAGSSAE